jgi:hypothetical protein
MSGHQPAHPDFFGGRTSVPRCVHFDYWASPASDYLVAQGTALQKTDGPNEK